MNFYFKDKARLYISNTLFCVIGLISHQVAAKVPLYDTPQMAAIPAGEYMRTRQSSSGKLEQKITIKSFRLAKHETTVGNFKKFINDTGHKTRDVCWIWAEKTPSHNWGISRDKGSWSDKKYAPSDNHPVMCITWQDAKAYAAWLSEKTGRKFRLPTEAEWEYAALGNKNSKYYFGDDATQICKYANVLDKSGVAAIERDFKLQRKGMACNDGFEYTAKVGSFPANPFGLYDMLGNVYEFVEDCEHNQYDKAPTDGSAWTQGCASENAMIIKKGSSYGFSANRALVSSLGHAGKDNPSALGEGFRLAETIDE